MIHTIKHTYKVADVEFDDLYHAERYGRFFELAIKVVKTPSDAPQLAVILAVNYEQLKALIAEEEKHLASLQEMP